MKGATDGKGIFLHRRFWNSFRTILWPLFWLKYVFFFFLNETCYLESGVMELNVVQEMQTDLLQQNPFSTKEHHRRRTLKSTVIMPQCLPSPFCSFAYFKFVFFTMNVYCLYNKNIEKIQ